MDFSEQEKKFGKLAFSAPKGKAKTSGRGGFLTSLISEGGGAGGAALGAGIGSIVPGIGTIIGAGIGGLLGGTGGRVLENKVRDDRIGIGDALKEGALSGVLGGAGEALSLAKAGKALTGEKGLANIGKNIVAGGEKKAAGELAGGITRLGDKVKSGGIGALDTKTGIGAFGDEASRLATAKKYNLSSGLKGLQQAETHVATLEGKIQPLLKNTKIPVSDVITSLDNAAMTTLSPVAESPQLLENVKSLIARQADGDYISGDALRQIRSSLGDVFKKNSTAPIAGLQKDFYRTIGDTIGEFAPKAKSLIGEQGALFDVAEGLSKKGAGARLPIPGVFGGKSQALGVARDAGVDAVSGGLGKIGAIADSGVGSQLIKQAPGNVLEAGLTPPGQPPALEDALMQQQNIPQGIGGLDMSSMDFGSMGQAEQSPISQENLIAAIQADIQQTGGKNIDTIQSLYKMFNPEPKAADAGFSRPTAQLYSQATTGLNSIDQLEQLLSQDGSLASKNATPGQNLPFGIGGLVSNAAGTSEYRAAANNILNSIARINTGAAMPPSEEAFYNRTYLPQPGDDPATIQAKLQNLRGFFYPIANYQSASSGGSDLADILMQQQGAY